MSEPKDEDRWKQLFTSINELSSSHLDLIKKVQATNDMLESINEKQSNNEGRLTAIENKMSRIIDAHRHKNIILFKLEDSDTINSNLFQSIS